MNITLQIKKLEKEAQLPKQNRPGDAAFDLYTTQDAIVPAQGRTTLKTGIAVAFPEHYVMLFRDRSGLAAKEGLTTMGGVIDSNYRGELLVILHNTTEEDYKVHKGDRIAQALLLPLPQVTVEEVKELDETVRGEKGFGSSGK